MCVHTCVLDNCVVTNGTISDLVGTVKYFYLLNLTMESVGKGYRDVIFICNAR